MRLSKTSTRRWVVKVLRERRSHVRKGMFPLTGMFVGGLLAFKSPILLCVRRTADQAVQRVLAASDSESQALPQGL
jgi:hypothetical protein